MDINLHILTTGGRLKDLESTIQETSNGAIKKVTQKISVNNVDIVFYDSVGRTIEHLGFGGYTVTPNLIMIPINPDFPEIETSIKNNLATTITHELYHCLKKYFLGQNTLLQCLINEGLAEHFTMEVLSTPPEKWDKAISEEKIVELIKRAEKEYESLDYNYRAWFFGSEEENIPQWAGYSIGFYLVDKYLKSHPEEKPSALYDKPIEDFI